jgi:RNA polymerase sigma-70 factor (family 1)
MKALTEQQALLELSIGLESGLSYLFNEYQERLTFYAFKLIGDWPTAEELTSDAFLKLWKSKGRLNFCNSLKGWLYTTVYNAAIDHLRQFSRSRKHRKVASLHLDNEQQSPAQVMISREIVRDLNLALKNLPPRCGQVLSLFYIHGKKYGEIATTMNISINTVRNHKVAGIRLMKEKLSLFE